MSIKGVSFIEDSYYGGCLLRGCTLQCVSMTGMSFEGVSSIGCLLKVFSVIWVTVKVIWECLLEGCFIGVLIKMCLL